jgi:hypothetical protein
MSPRLLTALTFKIVLANVIVFQRALGREKEEPPPPSYSPYPPGILPSDLPSEITRVQDEIRGIFDEAQTEWLTLPPLIVTGNPPTIQGSGYQAVEVLGKLLNFDLNMSPFKNEASAFCHMPYAGFSRPIPAVNLTMIAYPGTYHFRAPQADSATTHLFTGLSPYLSWPWTTWWPSSGGPLRILAGTMILRDRHSAQLKPGRDDFPSAPARSEA